MTKLILFLLTVAAPCAASRPPVSVADPKTPHQLTELNQAQLDALTERLGAYEIQIDELKEL